MNKRLSRADLLLLTGWLALLVLAMAWTTLGLPYLSDDFEHGQLIAQIRAGLAPGRELILRPFHGQIDMLIRVLFWFGTLAGGMSLTWVRFGICATHVAGAVGCAVLCARWTGSKPAGWLGGTLYAGALGFIGEQIWWPSSGIFCLGVTFFIFALAALDRNRIWLCLAMLAIAALGLNGILAAALGLPFCYWLLRGRRPPAALLSAMPLLLIAGLWRVGFSVRGLGLGAWLVFTAPFRFFSAWTTLGWPGFRTIWELSPVAWLALLASLWFMNPQFRRILLAVWTPAILLAMLVGMARADHPFRFGPGSLYTADRYYYVFLLPLVTHCILLMKTVQWRFATPLCAILIAAGLVGSRAHYLANVPRGGFEASGHALQQGRLLVENIRSSQTRPPVLTDKSIPLDGARNNSLTLAFLIYSEYPRGIPGVRLVKGLLNLNRASTSRINFKDGSYEQDLISGFSWWEPPFRWMERQGSLQLIAAPGDLVVSAYAPVSQLHRPVHVAVEINGQVVGELAISQTGTHDYRLKMPVLTQGSTVNVTLTSDMVWHSRDIYPDSLDERDLSIAVSAIGFGVVPLK